MDASGWQNKHMAAFGSRSAGVALDAARALCEVCACILSSFANPIRSFHGDNDPYQITGCSIRRLCSFHSFVDGTHAPSCRLPRPLGRPNRALRAPQRAA